jgi:hypothetical protein
MSDVWCELPEHLADLVCNQLPKVRRIPENLKTEIVSQRWMLAKSYNYYLRYCQFHGRAAMSMMKRSMGIDCDPNDAWAQMTQEKRLEFYYGPMGPGSQWARDDLERQEMFREWLDEY